MDSPEESWGKQVAQKFMTSIGYGPNHTVYGHLGDIPLV
jgi:hypothetical protein